ncbi:MAG: tRNA dihydrouridine synthase DusB [Deltaproteobacteria bacterium]|nr:MAG: tRNA dihydrouridine synthase DusB [Deltaproteobacteria bacterium]
MQIGTITLDNPLIMAPLAGISNLPFRLSAKKEGCALVCSEMISSNGLVYKSEKTLRMLESAPEEKPLSIQIFGTDPSMMAEAATIAEASGADILDINFGCSVKKVIKTGAGVALMKTPRKAAAILTAVRQSIKIPLTVKIRTGWEKSGTQAVQTAKIAESCGADAIAVHPRTATQGFGGQADWTIISTVKKATAIPIIGNGDIVTPEDAVRMRKMTGCDGVMIGRAAIGNPWIFSQCLAGLRGENILPVYLDQRFEVMKSYVRTSVEYIGERPACRMLRSRLGWFVKGLRYSSKFRESIKHISSEKETLQLIDAYKDFLQFNFLF